LFLGHFVATVLIGFCTWIGLTLALGGEATTKNILATTWSILHHHHHHFQFITVTYLPFAMPFI
jgi:hypothetical protein